MRLRRLWWEINPWRWGEGFDAKKQDRKEKAKVERLNYTSCSRKDRRGSATWPVRLLVAIRGANGRRKQGSLNRAYQTRNKDTISETVTAYHCLFETVDCTEKNQEEKGKRITKLEKKHKRDTLKQPAKGIRVCVPVPEQNGRKPVLKKI